MALANFMLKSEVEASTNSGPPVGSCHRPVTEPSCSRPRPVTTFISYSLAACTRHPSASGRTALRTKFALEVGITQRVWSDEVPRDQRWRKAIALCLREITRSGGFQSTEAHAELL